MELEDEKRSTDPARFEGLRPPAAPNRRRGGEMFLSGLALLALVVGLPAVLLILAGSAPIPTQVPSLRDFAQQLSFEDLLTVLVAVLWLAWLYFIVCLVLEVIAARRGGLARSMPLAGPLQKLAQVLIGALLISGLAVGNANATTADHAPAPVSSSSTTQPSGVGQQQTDGGRGQVDSLSETSSSAAETAEDSLEGKKVYTVAAPKSGYHDNLWDIAEKHLGSGTRYKEIYQLNKDQIQPDGRKLELARLIQPGWHLVMPGDATGVAVVSSQTPTAPAPGGTSVAGGATELQGGLVGADSVSGESAEASHIADWMGGAGLLAAGIVGALAMQRRRQTGRRPDDGAAEVESEFRVAASLARSSWLDHALRGLSAACRRENSTPPPAYAALVDDDSVELLLAPPAPTAIGGWVPLDEGRRWRRERADVVESSLSNEISPYPALVSLGVDHDGRDVLVDLEAAGGIVSLVGDDIVASEVAAAIAVQSATTAWSDSVKIIANGLPEGMGEVSNDRIRIVDDLGAELSEFEDKITSLREDVLTGRLRRRGNVPSYLVVSGQSPDPEIADRLGALAGAGRQALSIVVAGEHKSARWRMRVDEQGSLTIPQLGLTVDANRISASQVEAVAELFAAGREPDRPDDGDRVKVPAPLRRHDDSVWTTAARRVGVLGKVSVQGPSRAPSEREDRAVEMISYLALHPEGVHPNVLGGVLWPRGVTNDVRDATIDRARAWLGDDVDGSHFLRADVDGRLLLAETVVLDWDCACNLFGEARRARDTKTERDLLRRALKLVRGEAFADVPEGRFGWVVRDDMIRTMIRVIVDGSHRLTQLFDDDPDGAAQAAESGLRINPGSQLLWRELMRARYAVTGVAGVQKTLDSMSAALEHVDLEPETEELIEELMPSTGSFASSS